MRWGTGRSVMDIRLDLPADDPDYQAGNEFYAPNPWPENFPSFKTEALAYQEACLAMSLKLMTGVAMHLQLDVDAMINCFQKPLINLRMLHYPAEPTDRPVDPQRIGTGVHTDYECLTLLHQRGEGGLQAESPDGGWYAVTPRPDAILLSVGDSLVRWSGGRYRALPHRVVNISGRRRFSLPFFLVQMPTPRSFPGKASGSRMHTIARLSVRWITCVIATVGRLWPKNGTQKSSELDYFFPDIS